VAEIDRNDLEGLAGEYVLGTLDADERRAAEARAAADPGFRRSVADWELRLQPLADAAPAATPSAGVFDRILARIDASPIAAPAAGSGNVVALRRSVVRWRITTAIVGVAAAVLAGIVVIDRSAPGAQSEFVAVLTAEGAKPAFVATVDVRKGTIAVRRVAAAAPVDKSYELWAVAPNAAPRSLGLVEEVSLSRILQVAPSGDITLAVSLEPKGGSKTGAPTGPVVFTGALVPTE
jgi:anti-sigma-K factor RskA